jgi:imidazoleglycerol phosphate dehydratase HisB
VRYSGLSDRFAEECSLENPIMIYAESRGSRAVEPHHVADERGIVLGATQATDAHAVARLEKYFKTDFAEPSA